MKSSYDFKKIEADQYSIYKKLDMTERKQKSFRSFFIPIIQIQKS